MKKIIIVLASFIIFLLLFNILMWYEPTKYTLLKYYLSFNDYYPDDQRQPLYLNPLVYSSLAPYTSSEINTDHLIDLNCPDCNVIMILIEPLRADHVGSYGYARNVTPHLDKVAEKGIIFTNFIATSSWIAPATGSILTGLYPQHHGAYKIGVLLAPEVLTLPEILQEHGYDTYGVVTTSRIGSDVGFQQGFDTFLNLFDDQYDYSSNVNKVVIPHIQSLNNTKKQFIFIQYKDPKGTYIPKTKVYSLENRKEWEHIDTPFTRPALELIEKNKSDVAKHFLNLYDDEILFTDAEIGKVLNVLQEKGMYNNSIIIITSPYGEGFADRASYFSHSYGLNEELINVPLIIHVPPEGRNKRVITEQMSQVDLQPTLLSLLQIKQLLKTDGINIFSNTKRLFVYSELFYWFRDRLYVGSAVRANSMKFFQGIVFLNVTNKKWVGESVQVEVSDRKDILLEPFFLSRKIMIYGTTDFNGIINLFSAQSTAGLEL